jgi:hypothetical protein
LYTGSVALKDKIAKELYDNFLLLSVAIHLLANPSSASSETWRNYAHTLLVLFNQHFSQLYGPDKVTYNVHGLVHLAEDVKAHGNLDMFSAFPFENFLGQLKKMVRKPNFVLQQVIMRIAEKSKLPASFHDHSGMFVPSLYKKHLQGPLPAGHLYHPCSQYGEAQLKDFTIAAEVPNHCVEIGSDVALIQNILQCETGVYVVYKVFGSHKAFFTYPLDSEKLDIHLVEGVSEVLYVSNVELIKGKYVLLPFGRAHVAMPVIHTV